MYTKYTVVYISDLVAVDRGVTAVGGVAVIFCSTPVLYRMSLTTLQSEKKDILDQVCERALAEIGLSFTWSWPVS